MNPSTLNNVYIRDIFEGYLTYMNVEDMDTNDRIALRDLYTKMRTIITYHDMDLQETWARVTALKNEADAIEINIETQRRANAFPIQRTANVGEMTLEELENTPVPDFDEYMFHSEIVRNLRYLNPDLSEEEIQQMASEEADDEQESKENPSPNIVYCNRAYPSLSWRKYAAIQLKFLFDEDYKKAYLENEHTLELVTQRRELDGRLKRMLIHNGLFMDMFCCTRCAQPLTDAELDEKAVATDYNEYAVDDIRRACGLCRAQMPADNNSHVEQM